MAEVRIDSSIAGVLNSLVPLFVLGLGALFFKIKVTRNQNYGVLLGLVGSATLLFAGKTIAQNSDDLIYAIYILVACLMYAMNGLLIKEKLNHVPSIQLTTAMFFSLILPSFIGLIWSGFLTIDFETTVALKSLGFITLLSIFGTAIANLLFFKLIQKSSAVLAATVTYIMPIVSLFWGVLDGESIKVIHFFSVILIFIGIYLINTSKKS